MEHGIDQQHITDRPGSVLPHLPQHGERRARRQPDPPSGWRDDGGGVFEECVGDSAAGGYVSDSRWAEAGPGNLLGLPNSPPHERD